VTSLLSTGPVAPADPTSPPLPAAGGGAPRRWLPFAVTVLAATVILLATGTSPVDLLRYAGYATLTVALPGTLVYRALRRTPFTFVEDVAMGVAVGLCLELVGWAVFSAAHLQQLVLLWPLAVLVPFAAVPRLRRHWRVTGYPSRPPLAWSWGLAGVVIFFLGYLWAVFLARNPILPTSESTRQYLDLGYQLSLAGDAKHHFPLQVPQVAGEPLYYHWFSYVHMANTSLIGHIDLPVVALRLSIPALSVAAIVLTAVVGWRVSGRPAVGLVASVLFWVIGEVNFAHLIPSAPFGTQATFVIWHGVSMIYSWVLLLALIPVLADLVGRDARAAAADGGPRVPGLGRGGYLLAALLLLGSSGAKASSLPVVLVALAATALVLLVTQRRIPWSTVLAGLLGGGAFLFATAVLFHFQTYGLAVAPLNGLKGFWYQDHHRSPLHQWALVAAVVAAYLINMNLRQLGIVPLLAMRRMRLTPAQWLLLFGGLAGPALFNTFGSINAQYFSRTGFTFGVLLSAWGFVLLADRARLDRRAALGLGALSAAVAVALVAVQLAVSRPAPSGRPYSPLVPIWKWSAALAVAGAALAVLWWLLRWKVRGLAGRGTLVAVTLALVCGAPGLVMDADQSIKTPNGGPYFTIPLPKSEVDAARWVRGHSATDDVLATNSHCLRAPEAVPGIECDSRVFWLSAYSERSVVVEGWDFAPRMAAEQLGPFWDPQRMALNDSAFTAPTADVLTQLRTRYHVRWLVADRAVATESPLLATLATRRFDNGQMAVYELTAG
jgi:hypothetical protein